MEIYVRRAERNDAPQMLLLLEQLDVWHRNAYPERFQTPTGGGRSPHSLIVEMADAASEYWVAVYAGKVLGLVYLMHRQLTEHPLIKPQSYLLVDMLVVGAPYQGKGIGKMLMGKAKERAEEEGYSRLEVKVYEKNQKAMEFYEQAGYKTLMSTLELKLDSSEKKR